MAKNYIVECNEDLSFNLFVNINLNDDEGNYTVIVKNGQEALLVKNGILFENLEEGKHNLNNTKRLNYSEKSSDVYSNISTELYFFNREINMRIKWGTPQTFFVNDPQLFIPVELGACGEMQIKVSNARMFVSKVIGQKNKYNVNDFKDFMKSKVTMLVKDGISNAMVSEKVGFYNISTKLVEISKNLKESIGKSMDLYGIKLDDFTIETITLDENIKKTIQEAYTKRAVYDLYETNFQEEQDIQLRKMEIQNKNSEVKYCADCGLKLNANDAFCPDCGAKSEKVICDNCGHELKSSAKFCTHCGQKVM